MPLTKREIDRLKYAPDGPKQQIHFDDREPGFGVRVFPSGVKSFVVWYRTSSGRKGLHTLGRYGALTLDQARKAAGAARAVAHSGVDPAAKRRSERQGKTVRDLAQLFIKRHARPRKKTWKEDQRRLDKYVLPALGSMKVAAVERAHVAQLHSKIGEYAPYEANRVLALVGVMFNAAAEYGLLDEDRPNPAARLKKFKERSRDRWITPAELPKLVKAIDAEPNIYIRAALRLYLLTGLRRSELLDLRWRHVDVDRCELRLGDTKPGRPHVVPLSAPAIEVLENLPRQHGNDFVFPGTKAGRPLVNISKPWERIRARFWLSQNPDEAAKLREQAKREVLARPKHASTRQEIIEAHLLVLAKKAAKGEEDVRLHDLRRTVGSWLATGGASLPLIGKVLNHSNVSTTQIYARLAEDATRVALEEHGERIGPMLKASPGDA